MIREIISTIKQTTSQKINEQVNRFTAASTIEELLEQIDFASEEVPIHNAQELQKLFQTLKGEALNSSEIAIIHEITEKANGST
ncbi:hypothetical protein ACFQ5N_07830 [Lutibacter holmesii]|uniref:Uncharacterized protein n=1 Tax=Lutibacter holmesii TaxID=1137985 RepID=A0ABW3WND9_9FLAO